MTRIPLDLSRFPRIGAFHTPTPFEEMPRLRAAIGARPRLFVKRDDAALVGLGGNKTRKLDFVMADARQAGADLIVTWGGVQSNHCRQTAAFARRIGMDCHLILTGDEPAMRQGNLLLFTILGAELYFIGGDTDAEAFAHDLTRNLRCAGRKPYCVPIGASVPLGAIGYAESLVEVAQQAESMGVRVAHVFLASGSAGTQAGAIVGAAAAAIAGTQADAASVMGAGAAAGARASLPGARVHGVSVSRSAQPQGELVAGLANGTFALLGMPERVAADQVIVHDQYYGSQYGVATPEGIEAIRLVARTEGLLLDPVYTGKAMAGMLDQLRRGNLDDAEAVVFIHTGGFPALFAQAGVLQGV